MWQEPRLSPRTLKALWTSVCPCPCVSTLELKEIPYLQCLRGSDNFWKHINKWFLHCETISHAMTSPLVKCICLSIQLPFSPSASERKKLCSFIEKEGGQDQKIQHCPVLHARSLPLLLFLSGKDRWGNFSLHSWQVLKFLSWQPFVFRIQTSSWILIFLSKCHYTHMTVVREQQYPALFLHLYISIAFLQRL